MSEFMKPDRLCQKLMSENQLNFSLEAIFPEDGAISSVLVMRLPVEQRIAILSWHTEFLVGAYLIGKALDRWARLPKDPHGGTAKIFIPVSLRVLSDYRFVDLVTQNEDLKNNATWFMLMGTPDSAGEFPENINMHELANEYRKHGISISIGEIDAQHIRYNLIQPGVQAVLPSIEFEQSPAVVNALNELKAMAKLAGVMLFSRTPTPWRMTLPEATESKFAFQ